MSTTTMKHWRSERNAAGVAWLHLDKQDASTNVLSAEVLEEFNQCLATLEKDAPTALVILSDKPTGFIAGADIKEFTEISDQTQALALIKHGQSIFDRLEALPFPTIALIHGFCVGGGLELALACRYRIALEDPKTRLGLPEILLGIHPGFGGSVRLIRKIGAPAAMDLMLSGRTVDARAAKRLGFVDMTIPERHFFEAPAALLKKSPPPRQPGKLAALASHPMLRGTLAWYLRRQVKQRARPDHYPAPYALIDLWQHYYDDPRRMLDEEAKSVAHLITTPTSRNLVRVFFLQERLKGLGRKQDFTPKHVHVIGAGVMGGDIAAWCALQGMRVTLQDREPKFIAPAMKRAHELFGKRIRDKRLRQAALDRLQPDILGHGVKQADVVIEAIIENIEAKQALYRIIEPQLKPGAILATNTSSIPLETLAAGLLKPERLVGIHFFNPVAKMQLVEIIKGEQTAEAWLNRAQAFTRHIDRLPLPVKSSPGFLVNRVLVPYLLEAMKMLEEGTPAKLIDSSAVAFGMPMGPITLADTVGLDVCLAVGEVMAKSLGMTVPNILRTLVAEKKLGRKSGQGFYDYKKAWFDWKKFLPGPQPSEQIADRLIGKILNESRACLQEGVVADADLLDAGIIFGTGFAPFRGGPMQYAKDSGK